MIVLYAHEQLQWNPFITVQNGTIRIVQFVVVFVLCIFGGGGWVASTSVPLFRRTCINPSFHKIYLSLTLILFCLMELHMMVVSFKKWLLLS